MQLIAYYTIEDTNVTHYNLRRKNGKIWTINVAILSQMTVEKEQKRQNDDVP